MDQFSSYYRLNPYFSKTSLDEEGLIVSVEGNLKIIKGSPVELECILSMAKNGCSVEDVINRFGSKYDRKDIEETFFTLVKEKLLVSVDQSHFEIGNKGESYIIYVIKSGINRKNIAILGGCSLANFVAEEMSQVLENARVEPIESGKDNSVLRFIEEIEGMNPSCIVYCPPEATQKDIMDINSIGLSLGIPVVLCYFNGGRLVLGPTVIPFKSPCYGCFLEHRRSFMSKQSGLSISLEHFHDLVEAWSYHKDRENFLNLRYAVVHLAQEVINLVKEEKISFYGRQLHISQTLETSEVRFEPTTTCPICHGMLDHRLKIGRPKELPVFRINISFDNAKPVIYREGGWRSVSGDESIHIVEKVLKRTGFCVNVERVVENEIDNLLFRYTSILKSKYKPSLPFYLSEDIIQRGKGLTEEQAYLSASFELFERLCSRYYGDVEVIRAPYCEVDDIAIDVQSCIGTVYHEGIFDSFEPTLPIDWVWGYSLVHRAPRLVPASLVFITAARLQGQFFDDSSSGLAAGATLEDAILQALFEVIEHDAWMIWQANDCAVPELDVDTIKDQRILVALDVLRTYDFQVVILDYTTDIGVPVFRTWIINPADYRCYATNGFGAHLDPVIAVERSISEAWLARGIGSTEPHNDYSSPSARNMVFSYYSLYALWHFNIKYFRKPKVFTKAFNHSSQSTESVVGDIEKTVSLILKVIPEADIVVVDLTKECLGIPVVRVVVSGGLQRFSEPILSTSKRLFELPVKYNLLKKKRKFEELYNGPFPH